LPISASNQSTRPGELCVDDERCRVQVERAGQEVDPEVESRRVDAAAQPVDVPTQGAFAGESRVT